MITTNEFFDIYAQMVTNKLQTRILLDIRRQLKDGTYHVALYLNFKGKQMYIKTGISALKTDFDSHAGVLIGKNARIENQIIHSKRTRADNILLELSMENKLRDLTPEKLKNIIETGDINFVEKKAKEKGNVLFTDFYKQYISKYSENRGTLGVYKCMFVCMSKFSDVNNLYITDINLPFVKDFDVFMIKKGLKTNTRAFYMRNIRAIINDAIDRNIYPLADYPFRRFKIKKEQTEHRAMELRDLIKLRNYPCTTEQQKPRDIFMLSFYLRGLNPRDLLHLTQDDIRDGYIITRRTKTGIPLKIKIEPEAAAIIEKYKGINYILNPLDTKKDYLEFCRNANCRLKDIGGTPGSKYSKSLFPYLSMYWARHTWATIAADLDIEDKIISIGLGHSLTDITETYIRRSQTKIDEANRKIIDHLNNFKI
ncbi:tyrosine recombinase [Bacteroidia bacterium]|nr:tyrosine recombinase [Bacteroidia bacterium]